MKMGEAAAAFLQDVEEQISADKAERRSLDLLTYFFTADNLDDITPCRLRDFLARHYIEKVSARDSIEEIPRPDRLISTVREFFSWADQYSHGDSAKEYLKVIAELEVSLPRALEIFITLSSCLARRGGAFTFPEYLISFEEGGRSQYDIDEAGDAGAREGYFRVIRIEGIRVEAEELITEESIWPLIFPEEVAPLLEPQYIINLEIIRASDAWHIASCGFAYPPGTEILEG